MTERGARVSEPRRGAECALSPRRSAPGVRGSKEGVRLLEGSEVCDLKRVLRCATLRGLTLKSVFSRTRICFVPKTRRVGLEFSSDLQLEEGLFELNRCRPALPLPLICRGEILRIISRRKGQSGSEFCHSETLGRSPNPDDELGAHTSPKVGPVCVRKGL